MKDTTYVFVVVVGSIVTAVFSNEDAAIAFKVKQEAKMADHVGKVSILKRGLFDSSTGYQG